MPWPLSLATEQDLDVHKFLNGIEISYNYASTYEQHTHIVTWLTYNINETQTTHHNHTMIKL